MGISGRLEDLSAADALQFMHMSARSGQLTFEAAGQRAWLALREGRITGASMPGCVPPIGKVLCEMTGALQSKIDEVGLACRGTGTPLGSALIAAGIISKEQLRVALTRLIRMVVAEVIQWSRGSFVFESGVVERSDDIGYVPEELLPDIALDVQEVLLDALRTVDEAARPGAVSIPSPALGAGGSPWLPEGAERPSEVRLAAPHPAPQAAAMKVAVVLTGDGFFRYGITAAWACAGFALKLCGLEQEAGHGAAELVAGGADVVVVVHVSGSDAWSGPVATARCIRRIKALAPSAPILVIGRLDSAAQREAFRLGVRHVLETPEFDRNMSSYLPQFQKFEAALRDAVGGTFEDLVGSDTFVGGATSDIKRLAQKLEGLRRSTEKRAVALGLLEYVAENVERAVMFLVGKDGGTVIGAFGANGDVPLSQIVAGMRVSYADAPVLRSVVETGRSFRGSVNPELIGCVELFQRVGRPRTGHAMFLPVRGVTRVFAALYLDNGSRTVPLVSTEALQILSAHAGLMLENLALQRTRIAGPRAKAEPAEERTLSVALPPSFHEGARVVGSAS